MCAALAVMPVSAANVKIPITGWESSFIQIPDDGSQDNNKPGVEIITEGEFLKSGKGTLHIYGSSDAGNYHADAYTTVAGFVSGHKYHLSGSFYVTRAGSRACVYAGGVKIISQLASSAEGADNPTNQWYELSHDFELSGNKTFQIQMAGRGDIYADDLSIKEIIYADDGETVVGYGEELLSNGDLEADFVQPDDASFVSVASRDGANYIAVKSIYDAAVYEVDADGVQTKLELGEPVLANPTYNIKVLAHTGLVNNKTYRYIVKTVGANGVESDGVAASGTPLAAYSGYITANNWIYKNNNNNYGTVSILKEIGRNGSAGMKVTNMTDSNSNNTYLYIRNASNITLEAGKVYKLSFWAKSGDHNTSKNSFVAKMSKSYSSADGVSFGANTGSGINAMSTSMNEEWSEQVCYFKAGSEAVNILELNVNRHYEDLILDDFALYEVDENLNVVSGAQNLLADKNCGFEDFENAKFDVSYSFYPAYPAGSDEFGAIMEKYNLSNLSELVLYDGTDVVYIECGVRNQSYDSGKKYTFITAVYKDGALYDVRTVSSEAANLAGSSEYDKIGLAYQLPDLAEGDFKIKTFVMDGLNTINPLAEFGEIAE